MKFKSHIPRPLLFSRLKLLAVGIFAVLLCLIIDLIIAHAISPSSIAQSVVTSYNGTSDSNRGGTTAIVNGVSYTRTGYLCYMLTKDGATTGHPAYAFSSPGFNGIAGSRWVCTSRRGQSVSGWKAPAPWGVTPWENGGSPSNEPKIKEWMLDASSGVTNAQQFVKDCWGEAALKNFESDAYILVIETIMNFQYSVKGGDGGGGAGSSVSYTDLYKVCLTQAVAIWEALSPAEQRLELRESEYSDAETMLKDCARQAATIAQGMLESQGGSNRTFTSDPLIGTVPNLITYKGTSTVFDSYTNKVAPHAEKMKVSEAGFTAYTNSGNTLSDSEVQTYGVVMLIIHCKNDGAIHTYWQPHGSPGNPEPRLPNKTGTCNIVKGYYKENLTTGAKQSLGLYYELEVTPNIIVSGEPGFELVEWRVTTQTSTALTPLSQFILIV